MRGSSVSNASQDVRVLVEHACQQVDLVIAEDFDLRVRAFEPTLHVEGCRRTSRRRGDGRGREHGCRDLMENLMMKQLDRVRRGECGRGSVGALGPTTFQNR